ncbi:hypothetical protein [Streptomyces sp. RKAG337]|uniref:hypothetical protein n=1 Tax=Streptomyces sp. RKAG337 TaxID=2893404 RepID=UPI0020346330|nr:hypothetical protein [Streptomyces sp. RKAG337]MCM2430977.1 hypothetical protein [Streptomyces sp. RKAG337]
MTQPRSKKTNSSNRQQIAKALRRATGCSYQQALHRVEAAAAQGLLPAVLDKAGRDEAVRLLSAPQTPDASLSSVPASSPPLWDDADGPQIRSRWHALPGGRGKTVSTFELPLAVAEAARASAARSSRPMIIDLDPQHSLHEPFPGVGLNLGDFEPVIIDVPAPGSYDPTLGLSTAEQEDLLRQLRSPGPADG